MQRSLLRVAALFDMTGYTSIACLIPGRPQVIY